eukprot:4916749-Amphidinium_carterae.1
MIKISKLEECLSTFKWPTTLVTDQQGCLRRPQQKGVCGSTLMRRSTAGKAASTCLLGRILDKKATFQDEQSVLEEGQNTGSRLVKPIIIHALPINCITTKRGLLSLGLRGGVEKLVTG